MKKLGKNFVQVVKLLSDGEFHDGTSIGDRLGITRTAVWKVIKRLESYHVPIQSVKGKGYALKAPLTLLNKAQINKHLTHKIIIDLFEQVDSTNEYLKDFCSGNKIRACLSEYQTHGRARMQRQWHSPFGQNIYLSLLYPLQKDISELNGLSLVIALSACKAIEQSSTSPLDLKVKWPNDIVYNKQKLGGSLVEIQAESYGFCYLIIGIGLNINMQQATKQSINQAWTSLLAQTGKHQDRNPICAALINQLLADIELFMSMGLKPFLNQWTQRDTLFGQNIQVKVGDKVFKGKAQGINEHGQLLLKISSNKIITLASGDTTILKNSK